jgi:hypothetical protein
MKVNVFFFGIGIVMALLLAYWAFSIAEGQANDKICGIGSAICFMGTLIPMLGIGHDSSRISVNLRILSAVFFLIFLVSHFCLAIFGVRMPYYVIVNALLLLVFIAIYYGIGKKATTV